MGTNGAPEGAGGNAGPGGNTTPGAPSAPSGGSSPSTSAKPLGDPGGAAPGGAYGAGPGGQNSALTKGTAAFRLPATAVQAFIAALTAKDKDRLAQCTALHAPTEAAEKHRKIFAAIVEGSISDDELDEMSKTLAGYQVTGLTEATSTGRMGVLISKMDGRDRLQRKVTTRKEKEGWKVLDVDSALEFKFIQMPRMGRGGRRR
jgi:hypothetical protein